MKPPLSVGLNSKKTEFMANRTAKINPQKVLDPILLSPNEHSLLTIVF